MGWGEPTVPPKPPYKGDCVPLTPPAAKKGGVLGEP